MDSFFADLPKLASIFALAFFSFWPAIPAGLALGLGPVAVVTTTTLSYACGVALVALFGSRVRDWMTRRFTGHNTPKSAGRLHGIWERYGLLGLGLTAPMTVGAQIGAILGLALNIHPRCLFLAMSFGALLWSIALTLAIMMGLLTIQGAL